MTEGPGPACLGQERPEVVLGGFPTATDTETWAQMSRRIPAKENPSSITSLTTDVPTYQLSAICLTDSTQYPHKCLDSYLLGQRLPT